MSAPKKKLSKAEAGRKGGEQTKRRHGRAHYQEAGRKGFLATLARHWHGDKEGYLRYLRATGWLAQVQRLIDAQPPAEGPQVIELPPVPGLEDDDLPW